jgi:hypothetical protein
VPVGVVYIFEVIDVHHQHAKGHRLGFSPRGFATQLGKERLAGQQTG